MKALILAAGLGTRLLPYTRVLPKPLFTLNSRQMLGLGIERVQACGCTKIFINTHHLADQITAFAESHPAKDIIETVYEPDILDTGGAIANLEHELSEDDFLVINADVVCDFDLAYLVDRHRSSDAIATLLVHDFPRFNKLCVDMEEGEMGIVRHFDQSPETGLAFTGIQVLSPQIFDYMPSAKVFSSIDVYKQLCNSKRIKALKARDVYWRDMGTPDDYRQTSREWLSGKVFNIPLSGLKKINVSSLIGDGSDRNWFRASHGDKSLVLSDHGICLDTDETIDAKAQLNAFVNIGTHLYKLGLPVPQILGHDEISGQVALEDLGNTHLADKVAQSDEDETIRVYKQVIDCLIDFSQKGINDFKTEWTCQTPTYSKQMILDLECRYFIDAFIKKYMGRNDAFETLESVFSYIADNALRFGMDGLMHRDMQSKNIMIHNGKIRFIDFQSARKGPFQYDLASLLIDPYVKLPQRIQDLLLDYALTRLNSICLIDVKEFTHSYRFCCLTRNLQMLGAFGFLTRVKNKPWFESYIPHALKGLEKRLAQLDDNNLTSLLQLITTL